MTRDKPYPQIGFSPTKLNNKRPCDQRMSLLDGLAPFLAWPNLFRVLEAILLVTCGVFVFGLWSRQVQSNIVLLNYKATLEKVGNQVTQLGNAMTHVLSNLAGGPLSTLPAAIPPLVVAHDEKYSGVGQLVYVGSAQCPHSRKFTVTWNALVSDPHRRLDIDYEVQYFADPPIRSRVLPLTSPITSVPTLVAVNTVTGEEHVLAGNQSQADVERFIATSWPKAVISTIAPN